MAEQGSQFELYPPGRPALVFYKADWCPHCRDFMPTFAAAEPILRNRMDMEIWTIDADRFPEILEEEGVSSFPTVHLHLPRSNPKRKTHRKVQYTSTHIHDTRTLLDWIAKHAHRYHHKKK